MKNEIKKVVWLSRHPLNEAQIRDLAGILNVEVDDLEISQDNITWFATDDEYSDNKKNKLIWANLVCPGEDLVITGVFPPVALVTRPNIDLFSPVSRQEKILREDGSTVIKFNHVRWVKF